MVVFDNTFLTLVLHPLAKPPLDRSTKLPVSWLAERIDLLLKTLEEDRETIIIPTPVLTEFLILAGKDGPKYLAEIDKRTAFRVESFDSKAAVELAAIEVDIRSTKSGRSDKRDGAEGTWAKIKFDRQIVTIAKVNGAHTIYSDDEGVEKFAKRCGITVIKTWELPLPQAVQNDLWTHLEEPTGPVALLQGQAIKSKDGNGVLAVSPEEVEEVVAQSADLELQSEQGEQLTSLEEEQEPL